MSCDAFLGIPFNIAQYALMLELCAKWTGYTPGKFTMFLADFHIYRNHLAQVNELLTREPMPFPKLDISEVFVPDHVESIKAAFECLTPEQIKLVDYQSHDAIKAPMAV